MSISFNHPKDTMTSTSTLNLIVIGGTQTNPRPIRLSASSVIMPVRALPSGEAGAMVFDSASRTMKYHDGLNWIEILGRDTILEPIYTQINNINQQLAEKVDTVSYTSGTVPHASISGTQLNITFPIGSGGGGTGQNGLFTSSKQGAIQYYSLTSGMSAASIREQMSGVANGQNGRNGTQASPWLTNDGWCFSDGMWWTWVGESGTVTRQVPNLNQAAYLKPMQVSGVTQIGSVVAASGTVSSTVLSIAQLPPLTFSVTGQTNEAGLHTHTQKTLGSDRSGTNALTSSNADWSGYTINNIQSAGNHIHTFTGTTNTLGQGQGHTHNIQNVDVAHQNVAVLYNIATPSFALNETAANGKYVLKTGDVMTGSLTVARNMAVQGDDTNIVLNFRNSSGGERASVYHNSTTNTLRLRSSGGTEVSLNSSGLMTIPSINISSNNAVVSGKNIVRSVNGTNADSSGNVTLSAAGVVDVQWGARIHSGTLPDSSWSYVPNGASMDGIYLSYNGSSGTHVERFSYRYLQKLVNNTWVIVGAL